MIGQIPYRQLGVKWECHGRVGRTGMMPLGSCKELRSLEGFHNQYNIRDVALLPYKLYVYFPNEGMFILGLSRPVLRTPENSLCRSSVLIGDIILCKFFTGLVAACSVSTLPGLGGGGRGLFGLDIGLIGGSGDFGDET